MSPQADLFGGSEAEPERIEGGFLLWRGFLSREAQEGMARDVASIVASAPLRPPLTPWGKPMSVAMTSAGALGWVTDRKGYRYEPAHPDTGAPWPPVPESILDVWHAVSGAEAAPDSCLVNHYAGKARMGLHQDKDEDDFSIPVVSISLGDPARFRIGGAARSDPTTSIRLLSGDVLVMGGEARLLFHGVDRIEAGADDLLEGVAPFGGGRLNLTLRRARAVNAGG